MLQYFRDVFMSNEKKKGKNKFNLKNIGVDIDKNEYREIVLSNSNFPDASFSKKKKFYE